MASYRRRRKNYSNGAILPLNTLSSLSPLQPTAYGQLESRARTRRTRDIFRHTHKGVSSIEAGRDEIADDDENDELAAEKPGNALASSHHMFAAIDRHLSKFSSFVNRGQKRGFNASNIDEDELGDGTDDKNGKLRGRPMKRLLAQSAVAVADPPSFSRIEDIARKVQTDSTDVAAENVSFRVAAAVCQKKHLYLDSQRPGEEDEACSLLHVHTNNELRVFRSDGRPAEKYYHWLKITNKISKLSFSRDCDIIQIRQPADTSLGTGHLLVLKFATPTVASSVASWVDRASGFSHVEILEVERTKLEQTYEKTMSEITKAIAQTPDITPLFRGLDHQSQVLKEDSVAKSRQGNLLKQPAAPDLPDKPRDRIPRKDQMQLSTQDSRVHPSIGPPGQPSVAPSSRPSAIPSGQSPSVPSSQPSPVPSSQPSPELRTRRTRSAYSEIADVEDEPIRWSQTNTDWSKDWRTPLVFNRTIVEIDDVPRLDEGQFLNDNLISFGLRYMYDNIGSRNPDLSKRVYVHNSFFFTKLRPGKGRQINYDGVKSWTSKVDLFSYDYIVVPINENFHWWLAIICNPRKLDPDLCDGACPPGLEVTGGATDESLSLSHEVATVGLSQLSIGDQKQASDSNLGSGHQPANKLGMELVDGQETNKETTSNIREATQLRKMPLTPPSTNPGSGDFRVVTLDSLGRGHPAAAAALKSYLVQELKDKKKKEARQMPVQVVTKAVNIPQQNNLCDCGVYLLGYMQIFLETPDAFVQTLLRKEQPGWTVDANRLRRSWRDTVLLQQRKHQDTTEQGTTKNKRATVNSGTKMNERPENRPTAASSRNARLDEGSENPTKGQSTPLKETQNLGTTKTSPFFVEKANQVSERQAIGVAGKVDKEPVRPTTRTSSPVKSLNEGPDRRKTSSSPVENVKLSPNSTAGSSVKGTTPVKDTKATVATPAMDNIQELSPRQYYSSLSFVPASSASPRNASLAKPTSTRGSPTKTSPNNKVYPTKGSPRGMTDWANFRRAPSAWDRSHEYLGDDSMDSSVPQVMRATTVRHRNREPAIDLTEDDYTEKVYQDPPGVV